MGWSYDAVANRASEVSGGTTKTYTTPATSNRLSTVTQGTTTLRTFGYDAAGAIATDAKAGVTWTSTYDAEGRVVQAQSGTFTVGTYVYDAESKLAKRTASNVTPAVVTHYLYDPDGHVIAETTSAGVTMREYIWLGDMPVAVIDAVNTATPVTYFVHTDHLMRPLKMTNAMQAVAWDAVWKPFGETFSITSAPKLDLGFPGQWTQSENGLAWNWHRHYDPTTGRYTKPDPLRFVDGSGVYAYVKGQPTTKTDIYGLIVLPSDPSGLPPNWDKDPTHRDPGGTRWRNPSGGCLDFHPGTLGEPGYGGKDHWHDCSNPSDPKQRDRHWKPGEDCPQPEDDLNPDPAGPPPSPRMSPNPQLKPSPWLPLLPLLPLLLLIPILIL